MCLPGISLSPAITEERLMPAPKTGHHNRRQAAILIVVTQEAGLERHSRSDPRPSDADRRSLRSLNAQEVPG